MHRLAPVFIFNPVFLHFFHPPSRTISHFPRQLPLLSSSGVRVGERLCVCDSVCVLIIIIFVFAFFAFAFFKSFLLFVRHLLPVPAALWPPQLVITVYIKLYVYVYVCVCVYVGVCISPLLTLFFPVVQCLHFCVCLCVLFVSMCVCVCMYLDWRVDGNFACFHILFVLLILKYAINFP